ncbi:hypothetical protein [Ligilactobacillus ceti]|uniref:DUF2187 domain-containing protein n=1 Tax=Ligilactobacillus ceti DSM 22408 TaxID=1122146 RepID=A0A0R2KQ27_9LACO|nr:hypothetical protein [Ligilactobacillus ceti]KRN88503.1 hypothetical protein IV53_GL000467 [Ligilactobacillus ceti DSM 22408]
MEKTFEIGDAVKCEKFASLKHDFVGVIEKTYENSAMVMITEFDAEDENIVSDFHEHAIVSFQKMKKLQLNK